MYLMLLWRVAYNCWSFLNEVIFLAACAWEKMQRISTRLICKSALCVRKYPLFSVHQVYNFNHKSAADFNKSVSLGLTLNENFFCNELKHKAFYRDKCSSIHSHAEQRHDADLVLHENKMAEVIRSNVGFASICSILHRLEPKLCHSTKNYAATFCLIPKFQGL